MTETPAARPSGRDLLVRQEASHNFELARHGGSWMVVTGFIVAFCWIVGAAGIALGLWGVDGLKELPTLALVGGALAALVPALLMIMAGYMGRTNRRAAASNALVMEAAVRLMAPAREAGTEGITFAEQMKQAAAEVDRAMAHALSAMKAMAGEIGDERLRLESVAYASADNARELTERLGAERLALEGLARDLRAQMQSLNEAIPRQAQMMVQAAREASEEVSRADHALETRLQDMQMAGRSLSEKLVELDGLASDAATRTETLTFAVSRIEEKLDQSRRTVDAAVRAGEIAAAAAMTTGDTLNDAVSSALESARLANREINQSTRLAAEQAAKALAQLKEVGEQAAAAIRSAEHAAEADTVRLAQKVRQPEASIDPQPVAAHQDYAARAVEREVEPPLVPARPPEAPRTSPYSTPRPPQSTQPPSPQSTPQQPERAVRETVSNGHSTGHRNGFRPEGRNGHTPEPPRSPAPSVRRPSMEDELFDAAADALANAALTEDESEQSTPTQKHEASEDDGGHWEPERPAARDPMPLHRRFDDPQPSEPAPPETPRRRATDFPQRQAPQSPPTVRQQSPAAPPVSPPPYVTQPERPTPPPAQEAFLHGGALVPARPSSHSPGPEMGWRDIISDMSREDSPHRDREEVAEELLERLQSTGILLPETFRPKAKRKIAEAARRGERERKTAIIAQAGRQVDRVTQRLRNDRELLQLAREFISLEEEDALAALEQTQKTGRNASPRLAAYLLIDAAL
ncbi:coiled-coil domain-containing protein [Hyphomonas pacifica]|uniref:TipN n=1 Tax=Hyphomonas pacifica TaxID=1280941 RepID=A0A062U8Q4_9PROT|nr:hypothetical protein [Hyphomonas pacifica]KCZ53014.1 hypothetical protein HY2_00385 [Hyphomonas pacifica]RAN36127.1 hypothetical protein HY3_00685 [Hyphomonas pacifica]